MRQWRFEEEDEIDSNLVLEYIKEAMANAAAGKELKPVLKKEVSIPEIFKNALAEDDKFKRNVFNKLDSWKTKGIRRTYR